MPRKFVIRGRSTDHDKCISLLIEYFEERKGDFRIDKVSKGTVDGEDLIVYNCEKDVIEYVEVELDATESGKADKIVDKALNLSKQSKCKIIRLWLVSTSQKWRRMIQRKLDSRKDEIVTPIEINTLSPISIGAACSDSNLIQPLPF